MTLISRTRVNYVAPAIEVAIDGAEKQRLDAILLPFKRGTDYICVNRASFRKKYPDRWIAVFEEKVIGFNKNRTALSYKLRRRGIDPMDCVVEFIEARPRSQNLCKLS